MFAWTSHGTELKRFFRQPITLGAIAVLLLIPLLYGAMYVWAFWSPTDRLQDLPVALVNDDVPTTMNGQPLAAGSSVVDQLVDKKPLGWHQVNAQEAAEGVKSGKYYFSVTIPATFSSDIASLAGPDPTAAEIQVKYNDSNSFLAGELGSTAMVQIRDVVSQQIGEQATKTLVVGLSSARSGLSDASDGAFVLQNGIKTAKDGSQQLSVGASQLDEGAAALHAGAGQLAAGTSRAADQVSGLPSGVSTLNSGAQQLSDGLGQLQAQTPALLAGVQSLAAGASQAAAGNAEVNAAQQDYVNGVQRAAEGSQQVSGGLNTLDSQFATLAGGASTFAQGAASYSTGAGNFATGAGNFANGAQEWQSGASKWLGQAQGITSTMSSGASALADKTGKDSQFYRAASAVASGTGELPGQLNQIDQAIQAARTDITDGNTAQADQELKKAQDLTNQQAQEKASNLAGGAAQVRDAIYSDTKPADPQSTTINAAASQLHDGASELASEAGPHSELGTGLGQLSDSQQALAAGAQQLSEPATQLSAGSGQLTEGVTQLSSAKTQIDALSTGAQQLSEAFTNNDPHQGLVAGAKTIQAGTQRLADGSSTLSTGASQLSGGAARLGSGIDALATGGKQVAAGTGQLDAQVPTLVSGVQQLNDGAQQIASSTQALKDGTAALSGKAPELTKGLDQAQAGSGTLGEKLKSGSSQIPHDSADTQQQRATAISSPVQLATSYLHKVASWGEFFAPFFIGLGLWVGALISWLLLRPLQSRALMTSVNGFRMAWGSLNSALALAAGQVLIMLSVMHFAIGLDAHNWPATILFAFLVAAAFFALQQMLQIAFGSAVGKVIIISVLMLQLASAGGTYPIQTEPGFFQVVSRWMPMTYVVNGLREAITGGIGPAFWTAVIVLAAIFAVSLAVSSILAARKRMWSLSRLHPALSL
ncbi:putative membrane protein [Propionibacterium cyclohexanicum]|uniref:Putative membrane protein n=1 Tax=Propionibacterium cyclohexanicum TaxID=64702 RepID=A0A1H9QD09_9ACTN|nr:YhgE/Pip domain-containing protein [Propionibacterium cyclohexanicum]SER58292.1 putative membrane protein [Propionibacterium cyclohexanicum]